MTALAKIKGEEMDEETRAALDHHREIYETRHRELSNRVKRIEDVSEKLESDIEEIKDEMFKVRLDQTTQYGKLEVQISKILPEALRAVPEEIYKQKERAIGRNTVLWLAISALAGGVAAAAAIFALFVHG